MRLRGTEAVGLELPEGRPPLLGSRDRLDLSFKTRQQDTVIVLAGRFVSQWPHYVRQTGMFVSLGRYVCLTLT